MKLVRVCLCLSLLLLMSCEKQSTLLPPESAPFEGTWQESFNWRAIGGQAQLDDEATRLDMTRTSTLTLSNDQFVLRIQPTRRSFIFEPDTVYVGWADDTLYTGSYEVQGDLILFNRVGVDQVDRFTFGIDGDHLHIEVMGEEDPSGNTVIPMSSFLWAFSFLKTQGAFMRVD